MSVAESLLAEARETLARGGAHSARAACWIGRAALEEGVDVVLEQRQHPSPEATMRSKLLVLAAVAADDPTIASAARSAWHGLSGHCHHHAFELTPPAFEVEQLLDTVAVVVGPPVVT